MDELAGATGLEPATFGVTGRRFTSKNKARFDSGAGKSGPKARDSTRGVEPLSQARTAALLALMAAALLAFIATAWWVSKPCRPGERGFYIGNAMLMAGCPDSPRLIYRGDGSVTPP